MLYCLRNKKDNVFYIIEDALNADFSKGTDKASGEVIGTVDLDTLDINMEKNKLYLLVKRHPVESSHISSIGYHYQMCMLVVEFKTGAVYEYEDVPADIYEDFMEAKSIGTYFHKRIRDQYNTIKVRGPNEYRDVN